MFMELPGLCVPGLLVCSLLSRLLTFFHCIVYLHPQINAPETDMPVCVEKPLLFLYCLQDEVETHLHLGIQDPPRSARAQRSLSHPCPPPLSCLSPFGPAASRRGLVSPLCTSKFWLGLPFRPDPKCEPLSTRDARSLCMFCGSFAESHWVPGTLASTGETRRAAVNSALQEPWRRVRGTETPG